MTAKEKLMRIVESAKGAGLEGTRAKFYGMTDAELAQEYGRSGKTCREILDGYIREREEWRAARDLAATL